MRLTNVDSVELAGFKDKLICCFILAVDMVEGGIREFVNVRCRSLPFFLRIFIYYIDWLVNQ